MIVLTNSTAQTVAAGGTLTFDTIVTRTTNTECFRKGTGSVKMRAKGVYEASFSANIGGVAAGTAQVELALSGDPLAETTMISTTATAGDLNNVSTATLIKNCCCDYDRISVVNTGTSSITVGANPVLFLKELS